MADGEKIFLADKQTLDEIRTLLLSSEIGLAILKELLLESAGDSETIVDSIGILGENIGTVKECITDNTNGLGAIKEALEGRANEITSTAIKGLLENTEYGLDALKNAITGRANETTIVAVKELLENGTNGLNAIKTAISGRANESTSTAIKGLLENGTYGLNAIKTAISGRANESTSTAIKSLLENGTYGLNALKTAIGNSNKFTSTKDGVLQLKGTPTVSKTVDANNREVVLHSPEIIISGNGQIVMHKCVNNNDKYATINYGWVRMEDVIIDGVATSVDFQLNHGADYSAVYNRQLKFEFSKSFRCKVRLDGKVYGSVGSTPIPECDFGVHYYVQLR